jgi:hypothetical protein
MYNQCTASIKINLNFNSSIENLTDEVMFPVKFTKHSLNLSVLGKMDSPLIVMSADILQDMPTDRTGLCGKNSLVIHES